MDGITAFQKIQANGNLLPVIMLTAKSEIDDKVLGPDTGGYGIVRSVTQAICSAHNAKISAHTRDEQSPEIRIKFPA